MTNRERNLIQQNKGITKSPTQEPKESKKKGNLPALLRKLGNRTVQRLMIQRRGGEAYQLDDESTSRINSQRGNGAPLDSQIQMEMSEQMGFDMSGVRVHNSSESDALNRQMNAKAFTTGQDIFFKSGAYDPSSSSGKELLGHELTHVVQQGTGQVHSPGGMTVNAPGDQFEKEADAVASELTQSAQPPSVQTQEEEELAQPYSEVQRQEELPEEEVQMQPMEEEEEMLQPSSEVQRQEELPEEEAQMQPMEEEEEMVQPSSEIQRQEELPEEEL